MLKMIYGKVLNDCHKRQEGGKPRNCSKGFTLIELMVVVAILGILCVISIPLYLGYINKARIVSHLYPGLHSIETNITLYVGVTGEMPGAVDLPVMMEGADTTHFNVVIEGDKLKITINSLTLLKNLHGDVLYAKPKIIGDKVSSWELSGNLANKLGITN